MFKERSTYHHQPAYEDQWQQLVTAGIPGRGLLINHSDRTQQKITPDNPQYEVFCTAIYSLSAEEALLYFLSGDNFLMIMYPEAKNSTATSRRHVRMDHSFVSFIKDMPLLRQPSPGVFCQKYSKTNLLIEKKNTSDSAHRRKKRPKKGTRTCGGAVGKTKGFPAHPCADV